MLIWPKYNILGSASYDKTIHEVLDVRYPHEGDKEVEVEEFAALQSQVL